MASLSQGHAHIPLDRGNGARADSARWERRRVRDFRIVDSDSALPLPRDDAGHTPDAADLHERSHLVREFTQLSLSNRCGCDGLCEFVREHRDRYPDIAHVVDDLLVPSVRLLGEMWCDDDADFVSVTLASHRISLTLMRLEEGAECTGGCGRGPVLLVNAPDDQHGFGLLVIGFHLRRGGWQVEMAENPAAVFRALQSRRYAAVGISAAHDSSLAGASRLIAELRRRAPAGGLRIALGGASVTNGEAVDVGPAADLATDDPAAFLHWLEEGEAADNPAPKVDVSPALPQAN